MTTIHFLNALEGDCNIIQHDSGRISVIDVSNAYNDIDTPEEKAVKASIQRKIMLARTKVPGDKKDYRQKLNPDNPISYLKNNIGTNDIFRFIITHPDMDHLDGIRDLFEEFQIINTWDTDNTKQCDLSESFGGFNKEDWTFYTNLRNDKYKGTKRLTYYDYHDCLYWNEDNIKILCPTEKLVQEANENAKDYHGVSYVLLFTPPKKNKSTWKIIFAGDSHDKSWDYIIKKYKKEVENIDVLFAPHHGRDSDRDYGFLDTLNPRVTLLGNASSKYLAYDSYKPLRLTNNQAGFVIMNISETDIMFYVKNLEFAKYFRKKRGWNEPTWNSRFKAYSLCALPAN